MKPCQKGLARSSGTMAVPSVCARSPRRPTAARVTKSSRFSLSLHTLSRKDNRGSAYCTSVSSARLPAFLKPWKMPVYASKIPIRSRFTYSIASSSPTWAVAASAEADCSMPIV
eukprot:scaffold7851_cov323-Prasinococcus_capsulatus_cf.AAC.1